MGYNIQLRTSHLDVRPPQDPADGEHELGGPGQFFPWHADGPNYGWPAVDGVLPFMEMKVGYYLTDLTQPLSGAICVVRGSHRQSPWLDEGGAPRRSRAHRRSQRRPRHALVWRTALYHCLTPNLSDHPRKMPVLRLSAPLDSSLGLRAPSPGSLGRMRPGAASAFGRVGHRQHGIQWRRPLGVRQCRAIGDPKTRIFRSKLGRKIIGLH